MIHVYIPYPHLSVGVHPRYPYRGAPAGANIFGGGGPPHQPTSAAGLVPLRGDLSFGLPPNPAHSFSIGARWARTARWAVVFYYNVFLPSTLQYIHLQILFVLFIIPFFSCTNHPGIYTAPRRLTLQPQAPHP